MAGLDEIKKIFFQECEEQLGELEQGLLALESGLSSPEVVDAVFRAVHSIKGGAGAFEFTALVTFAHAFEDALDRLRSGLVAGTPISAATMLRAADLLADHVREAKGTGNVDTAAARTMVGELAALGSALVQPQPTPDGASWRLLIKPANGMYARGYDASMLLRDLERLEPVATTLDRSALPSFDDLVPEQSYLSWTVELPGEAAEAAIRDAIDFAGDDCGCELLRVTAQQDDEQAVPQRRASDQRQDDATTIRVDLDRIDRLADLVGELVTHQAILAQQAAGSDLPRSSPIMMGLQELERLTREMQASVMTIRAQPVKSVFRRMPRLVRELADATGKSVRLVTEGETTEVDKTVIERLSDPIVHMLRNAIDHGVELPEIRKAAGKPEQATLRLSAAHRSGRIVIEIADDGKGIDRARVKQIALAKGLIDPDAVLTDEETDNLIFLPGFSTASAVSSVSGRGVGMDVVKRSIQSLNGTITINSQPGKGSTFVLSLPLTLAVLDGMIVSVCDQTLVVPVTNILQTLKPRPQDVRALGPRGAVLSVRGGFVPIIDVGVALGLRQKPIDAAFGIVLLAEHLGGGLTALLVDAIRDQRQVVIKSLETHFRRVAGVAAATILGDGSVALILDTETVARPRQNEQGEQFAEAG